MKPIALNARTLGSGWRGRLHRAIALALGISGTFALMGDRSLAQIIPDATLGAESSVVTPTVDVNGLPVDLIEGTAIRGNNLFHSFVEFNVGEGLRIYFANPAGIENILTRVTGTGDAGSIQVRASDRITLSGTDTGLFASTQEGSTGSGGSIFIDPPEIIITDGAGISVNSRGSGNGGDLYLEAGRLILDRTAFLSAATASGEGGNITLHLQDYLLMRHNSLISATAGGTGKGGNLRLNSPFIVAVHKENSDIIANAFQGQGGQINITTQGIFGLEFRPHLTPLSDITASSEFGVQGTVTITRPDVNPAQGLDALPENLVNVEGLINQDLCKPAREGSAFNVTGRGGLPENPLEILSPEATVVEWATPEGRQQGNHGQPHSLNLQPSTSNKPLVEAQGWIIAPDGTVILTAHPPSATPQSPGLILPHCQSRR